MSRTACSPQPAAPNDSWDLGVHRANNLDFLRFLLATLVVLGHSWQYLKLLGVDDPNEPFMRLTNGQGTGGYLAVDGFFGLSGFLIAASWQKRPSLKAFLIKRCARIYPAFILAALLFWLGAAFPLVPPADAGSYGNYLALLPWPKLVEQMVFLQRVQLPYPLGEMDVANSPTWTIAYEVVCYWIVLLLGLCGALRPVEWRGSARKNIGAIVIAVAALLAIVWNAKMSVSMWEIGPWIFLDNFMPPYTHGEPWYPTGSAIPAVVPVLWHGSWHRFLACFLTGTAFYLWRQYIPRRLGLFLACVGGIGFLCVSGHELSAALPFFETYALLYIAFSRRFPLQRWAEWVRGDYSYGVYLFAGPIQLLLNRYFHSHLSPLGLFGLAMPLTLLVAFVSWHGVEKPSMNWATRVTKKS